MFGTFRLQSGRKIVNQLGHSNPSHLQWTAKLRVVSRYRGLTTDEGPSTVTRQTRKRRETTAQLNAVTQGLIPSETSQDEDPDLFKYPAVLRQVRGHIQKFDNCIVLTRVGNFYELYFEQASEMGPLLNLKVADRAFGPRANPVMVPMAGFPWFQLDRYLKVLVQDHGRHVAISEEVELDPSERVHHNGRQFDRQIKRIITPGTLIDENFLDRFEPSYVLAIHTDHGSPVIEDDAANMSLVVGLSWLELSSGSFYTQSTHLGSLASSLARINPREIVLLGPSSETMQKYLSRALTLDQKLISTFTPLKTLDISEWEPMLERGLSAEDATLFSPEEIAATSLLLQYVKSQVPGVELRLQAPVRQQTTNFMSIDKNSLRGLEVLQTLRDGAYKGSLLQAVRRTSTESGARLLAQRLASPSLLLSVINDRLDLVEVLLSDEVLLEELDLLLRRTRDTFRLVQRFSLGRGDADDLLGLAKTIKVTRSIGDVLESSKSRYEQCISSISSRFNWDGPQALATKISEAIDEEGLAIRQRSQEADASEAASQAREVIEEESDTGELEKLQKRLSSKQFTKTMTAEEKPADEDTWIMRRTASIILERLHMSLDTLRSAKFELEQDLRSRLAANTLTLKMTPGLGFICHVRGKDARADLSVLGNVRIVSSSKSTRSFYLADWTKLGNQMEEAKARIRAEEQNVFRSLREEVIKNLVVLRRNAATLDELDVSCSFARLAVEFNLKRPRLNNGTDLRVWQGRHLMVENGLAEGGRNFVPNDCFLEGKEKIWLITGPNMAGKSTFLRQTALISILAQTGSFVPAEYTEVGLVDQIFSRVGSADNLSQNQSTFMIEMLETAHILRHATHRSFVIMDEVGRGTTPEDGIAVGYSVLHHLQHVNRCRSLFATHFHALADMTGDFDSLACYCNNVVEESDGSFRFDHRLQRGVNRQSHALKVAKLAGMPDEAIHKAAEVLRQLKNDHIETASPDAEGIARANG